MALFKIKDVKDGYQVILGDGEQQIPFYEVKNHGYRTYAAAAARGVAHFLNKHTTLGDEGEGRPRVSLSITLHSLDTEEEHGTIQQDTEGE